MSNISKETNSTKNHNLPIVVPEGYRPSENEEFMNPVQVEYFRQKLFTGKKNCFQKHLKH